MHIIIIIITLTYCSHYKYMYVYHHHHHHHIVLTYLKSIVFISANAVLNVTQFLFLLHTQTDTAL